MAAQQMLGPSIQRAAPTPGRNRLAELLKKGGEVGLGVLGGQFGAGAQDWLGNKLFKPRNPAMIAAAQHPKYSLEADRAWSMAGGGE
tara:strand:- start:1479 stop:1739 length:261 start_codon:yes stop_codon:yes gene_type:complete